MPIEITEEMTSFVDSSASQKADVGKVEAKEKSSYRANRDKNHARTKREGCDNLMQDSNVVIKEKICGTRYFIIKSLNYENIQLSVEKGIWATQVMNEPVLEEAFNNSRRVILIFSVNSSGFFQGYAQMMSTVGRRRDSVWSQGTGFNNPWGRSFRVKWLRLSDLPFHKTLHLKNPLNEFKPVKISRDCQELPPEIGEALCELIDREFEEDPNLIRDMFYGSRPGDSGCSFPDEVYAASPVDMTWGTTSMLHPYFFNQYYVEASRSHSAAHKSVGVFPSDHLPVETSKRLAKHPNRKGNMLDTPLDSEVSSQVDSRQLSGDVSPLCSTLTEDEFLAMTYEEYVDFMEAHQKQLSEPASGQSRRKENSSSKERDGDQVGGQSRQKENPLSKEHYDDHASGQSRPKDNSSSKEHDGMITVIRSARIKGLAIDFVMSVSLTQRVLLTHICIARLLGC